MSTFSFIKIFAYASIPVQWDLVSNHSKETYCFKAFLSLRKENT